MRTPTLVLLSLLIVAVSASGNYTVRVESEECTCLSSYFDTYITIEPDNPGSETRIGGFDLTVSFDLMHMTFIQAVPGSFMQECGDTCSQYCAWEYFTYRTWGSYAGCCPACGSVNTAQMIAIANLNNGLPVDQSCYEPLHKDTLVVMTFLAADNNQLDGQFSQINFYWRPDGNPCGAITFSDQTGDTLLYTNSVVNFWGYPFDTSYHCSGPPPECDPDPAVFALDFVGGAIELGANERADVNLNGYSYEISDATLYTNYFIYGPDGFFFPDSADSARQVANSEINCDGLTLTVGDLVYLIRVITGDAQPSDVCPPCPRCAEEPAGRKEDLHLSTSIEDTLGFFGASGEPGEQRVPFYIYVANSVDIAALQARLVFDTSHVTPHFDTAVGDGESVEYQLLGRAWNYESDGMVQVKSLEPGAIVIKFIPSLGDLPSIAAGSGNILRVYMDVKPTAPPYSISLVQFVTEGYDYNLFSDMYGYIVWPELVGNLFEVEGEILPLPSCPVLFSYDGTGFVQNDPLLTACEASGYHDIVTDYYHLPSGISADNGTVRFQLREMEDEVTFLDDVELITVDHSATTQVAVGGNGQIVAYRNQIAPTSAVDHNGADRLAQVAAMDGFLFSSSESGHLVVTFPNTGDAVKGYHIPNALKAKQCRPKTSPDSPNTDGGFQPQDGNIVTIEILDNDEIWRELPSPPMRESARQASIVSSLAGEIESDFITIRISWQGYYSIDAVSQFVPADETPVVTNWSVAASELYSTGATPKAGSEIVESGRLILSKGDRYDFSFETDVPDNHSFVRDYVVKAVGRYQPDYPVHTSLTPNDFRLYDNYPNPFNPSTIISFDLPTATHVNLVIINALGQTVATLVDQEMGPGHKEVQWSSSSSHASGVYFYRLKTDRFEQTKKMVLMK